MADVVVTGADVELVRGETDGIGGEVAVLVVLVVTLVGCAKVTETVDVVIDVVEAAEVVVEDAPEA